MANKGGMKNVMKGLGLTGAHREQESPFVQANLLSKLTLWWMTKHMWRGFKRPLRPTDIHSVPPADRSAHRALKLERYWDQLSEAQKQKPRSLLKVTVRSNGRLLVAAIFFIMLGEACKFVQPFLIAQIVSFFKGKHVTATEAAGYATGMVVFMGLYSVLSTQGEFLGQVVAMRMRSSCTALLTRKATRLSSSDMSNLSVGLVINLLASDVEKFYNAASEFRGLFVGPMVLLTLLVLMAVELGTNVIPALCFAFLLTAGRLLIGNFSARLRMRWAKKTDTRISMVTEVVSSMDMVKAHCWENLLGQRLENLRRCEVRDAGLTMFLNGLNLNLGHVCDRVLTFLVIVSIILGGGHVDYKIAIQVLVWMKMGQLGFLNFPIGYSMWKQMEASMTRIQEFLLGDECLGAVKAMKEQMVRRNDAVHVSLVNASASWAVRKKNESQAEKLMKHSMLQSISAVSSLADKDSFVASGTFSLRNISINMTQGMHVGIIGPVGSGKTSLLLAILGSLPLGGGTRSVKGRVAYVPQRPWIRGDTVRNNILMGEKLYRERYSEVLRVCALQKDISLMENGDLTVIGDGGNSLSGGQKARISLARAVYRNSDIYILDAPAASLDAKITNHIFNQCIGGILKDKLVIIATNNPALLQNTHHVIALNEGRLHTSGTLEEVKKHMNADLFLAQKVPNVYEADEEVDVFEKQDKNNMLMSLLSTTHVKKEHAHIPTKRQTPFSVYVNYWLAGRGYTTMVAFCLLLLGQQALSIIGEWWMVYKLAGGSTLIEYLSKKSKNGKKYDGPQYPANAHVSTGSYPEFNTTTATTITQTLSSITADILSPLPTIESGNFTAQIAFLAFGANGGTDARFGALPPEPEVDQTTMLAPYAAFVAGSVVLGLMSVCAGKAFTVLASRNLYNNMFYKLLHAPMKSFSGDKAGEMVNRFARDTGRMDDIIPITINSTFLTAAIIISQLFYICAINYYVVLASVPFFGLVILFVLYSIRAIRDTKRLESEFRTPTFKHLQHLLNGLEVVRAFQMESLMIREADGYLDRHTAAWHMYIGAMYWMKMRLNLLVTLYLGCVLFIAFTSPSPETMATPIGLSLSYILVFMGRVQYCAVYSAMLDANMTSVEHISEYSHLPHEEREDTDYPTRLVLPPKWPSRGTIKYSHVNIIYPGGNRNALGNLSFQIQANEKLGIVGRTGAGKSTVFNVLLRFYHYMGIVLIDDVNIRRIGLQDLRNHITFLLQEPSLMSGTIRYNLDPLDKFTDDQIWHVLEKVTLKNKVRGLPGRLHMEIESDAKNFSMGQMQLLCMARALLNMTKIIILDEITANVDIQTSKTIGKMLAEEFEHCTIMHISHNLAAIMHYDKVLVIEGGHTAEFNHPHLLLQDPSGRFYSMVQHLGKDKAARLAAIAEGSYRMAAATASTAATSATQGTLTATAAGVPDTGPGRTPQPTQPTHGVSNESLGGDDCHGYVTESCDVTEEDALEGSFPKTTSCGHDNPVYEDTDVNLG